MKLIKSSLGDLLKIKQERINHSLPVIDLLIGDPDHKPPKKLIKSLQNTLPGNHGYTDQQGDLKTRATIAKYLEREFINAGPQNLFISGGSKLIDHALIQSYAKPGRKVVTLSPYYPPYINQILMNHSIPETYTSGKEMIEKLRTDNEIDATIIVTPNNPDGKTKSTEFLREAKWVCAEKGIKLIIDEAYKDFGYKGFASIASETDFENDKNIAIVRSFSKSLGISDGGLAIQ